MTDEIRYGHLSQRAHQFVCYGLLTLAALLGGLGAMVYNTLSVGKPFPYEVQARQMITERAVPGGEIGMRRLIEYSQGDCWRQYDRRAVSLVQVGTKPGYVHRFEPFVEQRLPLDLSGKWQTWTDKLPEDFTCGPAYLAETVTAACTWFERHVKPLRKPDVISPFEVMCPATGGGQAGP